MLKKNNKFKKTNFKKKNIVKNKTRKNIKKYQKKYKKGGDLVSLFSSKPKMSEMSKICKRYEDNNCVEYMTKEEEIQYYKDFNRRRFHKY